MEEHTVNEMLSDGGLEQIRRYLRKVELHGGYAKPDATSSGDLASELRKLIHRREIALIIVEAMKDETKLRRGLVDPLMEVDNWGQENLEVLREHMEDRVGDMVLITSLEDWDEQEDYDQKLGCRLVGMR